MTISIQNCEEQERKSFQGEGAASTKIPRAEGRPAWLNLVRIANIYGKFRDAESRSFMTW